VSIKTIANHMTLTIHLPTGYFTLSFQDLLTKHVICYKFCSEIGRSKQSEGRVRHTKRNLCGLRGKIFVVRCTTGVVLVNIQGWRSVGSVLWSIDVAASSYLDELPVLCGRPHFADGKQLEVGTM
jgi:hypothetical protein